MTLQLAVTLVTALWAKHGGTLDLSDYDEIDFWCGGLLSTVLADGTVDRHCAWYAHVVDGNDLFVDSLGQIPLSVHELTPA